MGDETTHRMEPLKRRRRLMALWEDASSAIDAPEVGVIVVGRGHACDLAVEHASVSRRHAEIRLEGERVVVRDLGSANGTKVGGRTLGRDESAVVAPGTLVEIGAAVLVVQGGDDAAFEAPPPSAAPPSGELAPSGVVVPDAGPMRQLLRLVEHVGRSRLSVLFLGETGVGKEILTEALHRASPRATGPLVRLNCGALPETLLEGELFGYEQGAFTGAIRAKAGLLEAAHGGTIFLDEIGDLAPATQVKLLRVVESREVTRLGALSPRAIDVRFVAATHKDLEAMTRSGAFREDLYYRLNGVSIAIPPLRERVAEIPLLARTFVARACREAGRAPIEIGAEAMAALTGHAWPGNIRELRNVLERAVVFADGTTIRPEHLKLAGERRSSAPALPDEIAEVERARIERALADHAGNQSRAARALGISRSTLLRRMDDYGLVRPRKG